MILSHQHRFIFIKGMKVGGTSVEMALSNICGPQDIITQITPRDEVDRLRLGRACQNYCNNTKDEEEYREKLLAFIKEPSDAKSFFSGIRNTEHAMRMAKMPFYNHMPFTEVVERCKSDVAEYFLFAVERNPYAKVLSFANMETSYKSYYEGGPMNAQPHQIKQTLHKIIEDQTICRVRNIDRYKDKDGRVVTRILRNENLQNDFSKILADLKLDDIKLPHAKRGIEANDIDPHRMMTAAQIRTVNELFADEFRAFGYSELSM